jgi:hypothetical protein
MRPQIGDRFSGAAAPAARSMAFGGILDRHGGVLRKIAQKGARDE